MLDNTITLPVDVANNGTTVDAIFTRDEVVVGRSMYKGPARTSVLGDSLTFFRSKAKRAGAFLGVYKSRLKFSRDFEVPTAEVGKSVIQPALVDINISKPVGVTEGQIVEMIMRGAAALASASTKKLVVDEEY